MLELETEIKSKVQKSICVCLRRTGLSSLGKIQSVICYIKYMLGLIQKKITTSLVSKVLRINNMWKKKVTTETEIWCFSTPSFSYQHKIT